MINATINPGRAFSMTRLDQLSKPKRRNGEHISAVLERERKQALELENMSRLSLSRSSPGSEDRRKSRSMSQLSGQNRNKSRGNSQDRLKLLASPLQKHHKNADATRSMTQLSNNSENSRKLSTPRSAAKANAGLNFAKKKLKKIF